ncbi:hypothetical protein GCM10008924_11430 [Gracilibacillus halotolerans]
MKGYWQLKLNKKIFHPMTLWNKRYVKVNLVKGMVHPLLGFFILKKSGSFNNTLPLPYYYSRY